MSTPATPCGSATRAPCSSAPKTCRRWRIPRSTVSQAAHHSGLARIRTGQERFRPNRILYFKLPPHQFPSLIVDVSDFSSQRRAAIEAYRSQLFDASSREPVTELSRPGFLRDIENIHRYYGTLIGKAEGEGFFTRGPLEIADPVDFFRKQASRSFF